MSQLKKALWIVIFAAVIICQTRDSFAQAKAGGGIGAPGGAKATTGRYEAYMSTGYIGLVKSATSIDLAPGLQYTPIPSWSWIQVGGEIMYQRLTYQGGTTKAFVIMAGPTLNFGPANSESTFVSLGVAIRSGSSDYADPTSEDPSGFGYYLLMGKRMSIGGGWSLRPTLGVMSAGTGGLVFRPFALSLFF